MSTPAPSINNVAPPPVTCDWLEKLMIKHLDIPSSKDFQLKHTLDLIGGKDLFLVAAPSSGKTTILMTVLLCVQARGESGIALLVVPHDFGAEMMAERFKEAGIDAVDINEDTIRSAYYEDRDLFKELISGSRSGVRCAFVTPRFLGSPKFDAGLLVPSATDLIRWVFIDEIQMAMEHDPGSEKNIKYLRSRLRWNTTWAVVSGTETPSEILPLPKL